MEVARIIFFGLIGMVAVMRLLTVLRQEAIGGELTDGIWIKAG